MNTRQLYETTIKGVEIYDLSLTPLNAKKHGYEYIDDIVFDIYDVKESVIQIIQLIYNAGYKLGTPSHQNEMNSYYGFYSPITTENTAASISHDKRCKA